MTDDHGHQEHGVRPPASAFLDPIEVSARRIRLIAGLDFTDSTDPDTWRTADGLALTDWQLRQLHRATETEWQAAMDWIAADAEDAADTLARAREQLEHAQRNLIVMRSTINRER